jgi:hypothetical protein
MIGAPRNLMAAFIVLGALLFEAGPAVASPSPSGTSIPPVSQITDSGSNVWTLVSGVIYENGAKAGYSANVTRVLYYNGTIYQKAPGGWWSWNGTGWVATSAPVSASASGTSIPSATQIVDSALNIWTVVSGVVYENGATAGYSANVIKLLYFSGTIYQENSSNKWWSWNGSSWVATTNPSSGVAVSGNHFINAATGNPVVLAGVNLDGMDGSGGYGQSASCPTASMCGQWAIVAGVTTAEWTTIAAKWGINIIRVPVNPAYWVNQTVYDDSAAAAVEKGTCCYAQTSAGVYTPDPSDTYQSRVTQLVNNITAANIAVILDDHCGLAKNSSGNWIACVGEESLPADGDLTFWDSVATTFQSNPLVIFGLYNEPIGDGNCYNGVGGCSPEAVSGGGLTAVPGAAAVTMIAGGNFAPYTMQANDTTTVVINGGADVHTVGMVALINGIRATGATNVILAPSIWYSGTIQTWLANYTTTSYGRTAAGNPDPIGQFAEDWHDYGWSSGTTPITGSGGVLAAGYPVIMSETYGFDSALDGGRNASGYTWAASNYVGVLLWAWATWEDGGCSTSSCFASYLTNTPPWSLGSAPAPTGNTFGQSPF